MLSRFSQEVMGNFLCRIEDTAIYLHDVGASMDWSSHVELLDIVLGRLPDNGLTIKGFPGNELDHILAHSDKFEPAVGIIQSPAIGIPRSM